MNPAVWLLTELTAAFGLSAEALIVCGLLLAGLLAPAEGLSGFSHIATVTIGAMFELSEGVRRTGALNAVGDQTNTLEYGSGRR